MRIGIFYDETMPYMGTRPDQYMLREIEQFATIINFTNYRSVVVQDFDCLINLHGQFFLKEIWMNIKAHIQKGKGFVNIGGETPFSRPVVVSDHGPIVEREQTAYHEELNIYYSLKIDRDRMYSLEINRDLPLLKGYEDCFTLQDTMGFIVQLTPMNINTSDGSGGPMDAVLYTLLDGYHKDGRKTAAPILLIENQKGIYEGGRWIFINQQTDKMFWEKGGTKLLEIVSCYAAEKSFEILVRTNYVSFYSGEKPTLLLQYQNYSSKTRKADIRITIKKNEKVAYTTNIKADLNEEPAYITLPLEIAVEKGMYLWEAEIMVDGRCDRVLRNGFWGYDRELLESCQVITCDKDYFFKDGKPMPIVGMTYMQADVHRKFIYLPNVSIWDRDFAEMKRAGINLVRTGIWAGFRNIMFNDGIANEEILRVIDAMLMTAKKFDIPVIFNFFAFTPETWEGINPYLDPRSIKAQKRYICSILDRHIKSSGVMWDLINEPTVCNPDMLWSTRPNGDSYELQEWRNWLKKKHKSIEQLQEKWNDTSSGLRCFETILLPEDGDFKKESFSHCKNLKIHDYILFTQEVLNRWAAEMVKTIRSTGSKQLVTIGQDEALAGKRPSPLFYQEVVDYTTNHSWWQNDDLYWDCIFCKTPDKPNLIQETGMMYVKHANGKPRWSEKELRNILERKYAFAFAANNAGAVQWVWNINIYLNSLNESSIGAVRADGGQKAEADVIYDYGKFMNSISSLFESRKEETVAVIFPYANDFSMNDYAIEATKKLTRVLGYSMTMGFKVYGEYHLDGLEDEKMIFLPSSGILTQQAWRKLMEVTQSGAVLYISGPFSYDEYWGRIDSRSLELGIETELRNVSREETLYIDEKAYPVTFGGGKVESINKEVLSLTNQDCLKVIKYGKGQIIWSPLLLEMNEREDVIVAAYRYALQAAGVNSAIRWIKGKQPGIFAKRLEFAKGGLYIFVSEYSLDTEIIIEDENSGLQYEFILYSNRIIMFAVDKKGNILANYKDWNVISRKVNENK